MPAAEVDSVCELLFCLLVVLNKCPQIACLSTFMCVCLVVAYPSIFYVLCFCLIPIILIPYIAIVSAET